MACATSAGFVLGMGSTSKFYLILLARFVFVYAGVFSKQFAAMAPIEQELFAPLSTSSSSKDTARAAADNICAAFKGNVVHYSTSDDSRWEPGLENLTAATSALDAAAIPRTDLTQRPAASNRFASHLADQYIDDLQDLPVISGQTLMGKVLQVKSASEGGNPHISLTTKLSRVSSHPEEDAVNLLESYLEEEKKLLNLLLDEGDPLLKLEVGQVIKGKVTKVLQSKKKPSSVRITLDGGVPAAATLTSNDNVSVGADVTCIVAYCTPQKRRAIVSICKETHMKKKLNKEQTMKLKEEGLMFKIIHIDNVFAIAQWKETAVFLFVPLKYHLCDLIPHETDYRIGENKKLKKIKKKRKRIESGGENSGETETTPSKEVTVKNSSLSEDVSIMLEEEDIDEETQAKQGKPRETLKAGEIDKARVVGRRALRTIAFREEGEKLNVWVALLNIENLYGTQETLTETFQEAVRLNDPLQVHEKMVSIFVSSGKQDQAEELYKKMLKRFRDNKSIWISCGEFYMKNGKWENARGTMQKALKSLPKSHHVEVISKFALMEMRNGEAERGKTLFETLLTTYPSRVDIWSIYVDGLVKLQDIKSARAALEKAISQSLPPKKMRCLFKKYVAFEELHGTSADLSRVRESARQYLARITNISME
ncbi:unnamed protein product [Darwinula stevensoni]|uniref:Pre-mRNA-splicing factor Syf1/CRNKL1-like C-terminal HAT-repeats domain-containing protein n=1 Tax=Darwinula stevensoni TaxID=69355 RepID=A0A7R9A4P2_9CRUS|nr:unnamed protein product [Darwinula stevensoni]CAG0884687.1 unnamed protein product [Darwinula stevensoni]